MVSALGPEYYRNLKEGVNDPASWREHYVMMQYIKGQIMGCIKYNNVLQCPAVRIVVGKKNSNCSCKLSNNTLSEVICCIRIMTRQGTGTGQEAVCHMNRLQEAQ